MSYRTPVIWVLALAVCSGVVEAETVSLSPIQVTVEPLTRMIHISYPVPKSATDEVTVLSSWSPPGKEDWKPAKVRPLVGETALYLVREPEWLDWVAKGRITERRAGGLVRTAVFNPYPEAQEQGRVEIDFRIEIQTPGGSVLGIGQVRIEQDNRDVVYIEDWSQVFQKDALSTSPEPEGRRWLWRIGPGASPGASMGNELVGQADPALPLPQLSYPLNLQGNYAIFLCTNPAQGGIGLRLSGDEHTCYLSSRYPREEVLWDWRRMDRQNLVLREQHIYTGWAAAHVDYVKLVPLSTEQSERLSARYEGKEDKFIAGYYEPYSWAFYEKVEDTLQHREPLIPFKAARIQLVDIQIGRFGDKVVYESRLTDPLFYSTIGDPIGNVMVPKTDNVGRMQQFTNTLDADLRYSKELQLQAHANFGASNCYPGTPLQSDFSKAHPDWMRGACLRFEVPEVRQYALALYRESLEIGAPGISIDFCRYPESIDDATTCNTLLAAMRNLAVEFTARRAQPVPILVRFPGKEVRSWENFDFPRWAREGWVDYLCPSNIQGRHHHIDIAPYLEAVKGTACVLLPCIDGLSWGPDMPGPFLWRVKQLYDLGVNGLYIYQADNRALGRPVDRRCLRLLASSAAVQDWWEEDTRMRPHCSKGIYLSYPEQIDGYHGWERLRPWVEGVELGRMEMVLDGTLVTRMEGPPYVLGGESNSADQVIPPGEHKLRIRVRDGSAWLEQEFGITGGK